MTLFQLSTDDTFMGEDGPLTLRSPRLELVTARALGGSGTVLPPALPEGSPVSCEGDALPDDRSGIVLAARRPEPAPDSVEWLDDGDLLVELDEEPLFLDDDDEQVDTEREVGEPTFTDDTDPPPPTLRSARF